jgi:hypothetical protein
LQVANAPESELAWLDGMPDAELLVLVATGQFPPAA